MAPHRKNKLSHNISRAIGTLMGYIALLLAAAALAAPVIGAYVGDIESLLSAAALCMACWLVAVLLTLVYRDRILPGMRSARVGDLVKLATVLVPAIWTLSLLGLLVGLETTQS